MVKEFHGKIRIHIYHHFKTKDEDLWYPTKKGVALSLQEWDKFNEKLATIDSVGWGLKMNKLHQYLQ